MKIGIAIRDKLIGYGTSRGDEVVWEGDVHMLKSTASYWEKKGLKGDELLRAMLMGLRSYMWAEQVPEDLEETATG